MLEVGSDVVEVPLNYEAVRSVLTSRVDEVLVVDAVVSFELSVVEPVAVGSSAVVFSPNPYFNKSSADPPFMTKLVSAAVRSTLTALVSLVGSAPVANVVSVVTALIDSVMFFSSSCFSSCVIVVVYFSGSNTKVFVFSADVSVEVSMSLDESVVPDAAIEFGSTVVVVYVPEILVVVLPCDVLLHVQ